MNQEIMQERLFDALVAGDRVAAREIVSETTRERAPAERVVLDLFWPVYERVEKMHRADQMSTLAHHLATRLLRLLVDQCAAKYERARPSGRTIFAVCGPNEADEMAAQMAVDLIESAGHRVSFAGGGIANDEILGHVQAIQPDVLLLFASAPGDLPNIRSLIDTVQEIGACTGLQLVVGGGVFARAQGLAEEIGADLWADTPGELLEAMTAQPERRATTTQRTVGRNKRRTKAA